MRSTLIFVCLRWSGLWWQQRQGLYLFVAALRQPFLQPIASQWCVLISGTPTLLEQHGQNMEHTVEHRHFYSWILAFLDKSQRTSSYFMMRQSTSGDPLPFTFLFSPFRNAQLIKTNILICQMMMMMLLLTMMMIVFICETKEEETETDSGVSPPPLHYTSWSLSSLSLPQSSLPSMPLSSLPSTLSTSS